MRICVLKFSIPEVDPYVCIKCEGKTVKSSVENDTTLPKWDVQALFYRKDPAKPIKVQV